MGTAELVGSFEKCAGARLSCTISQSPQVGSRHTYVYFIYLINLFFKALTSDYNVHSWLEPLMKRNDGEREQSHAFIVLFSKQMLQSEK